MGEKVLTKKGKKKTLVAIITKGGQGEKKGFFGFITSDKSVYEELDGLIHNKMSAWSYGLSPIPQPKIYNGLYIAVTQILENYSLRKGGSQNQLEKELKKRGYNPRYWRVANATDKEHTIRNLETNCIELLELKYQKLIGRYSKSL